MPPARFLTKLGMAREAAAAKHHLKFGKEGFLDFHSLMQVHAIGSLNDNDPYAGLGASRSGLWLRRGEIHLAGSPGEDFTFFVMFDVAKAREAQAAPLAGSGSPEFVLKPTGPTSVLQDFVITSRHIDGMNLSVGQALAPLLEGLWPSGDMMFAERSDAGASSVTSVMLGCGPITSLRRFRTCSASTSEVVPIWPMTINIKMCGLVSC